MMPAEKISSEIAVELNDLIETFVADRFTIMDDAVLDNLYADLPDLAYLKGMVKGLRRNLARQAADVNIEDAYPKINAGSMAVAMEQAKQAALDINVEEHYPTVSTVGNRAVVPADLKEDAEPRPVSMPELMVLASGVDFSKQQLHEKTDEVGDEEWEDDSVQPAHLLEQDPEASHRIPTTREFLQQAASPARINPNRAPRIERNFRSNLARYGIANTTLAEMASNARPGGLFSADTLKHSKQKDLLLVRSPITRPREHMQLLEGTDPQYYQYMWMAFEEALNNLLADDTLPDNMARHLDDELLINRMGNLTADAVQIINKIGNRDLLHVENVNTCIKLLNEQFPSVKLYTGDKVMEEGIWAKTWTHTTLKTPKGRFVFGKPEVDVVWQTN